MHLARARQSRLRSQMMMQGRPGHGFGGNPTHGQAMRIARGADNRWKVVRCGDGGLAAGPAAADAEAPASARVQEIFWRSAAARSYMYPMSGREVAGVLEETSSSRSAAASIDGCERALESAFDVIRSQQPGIPCGFEIHGRGRTRRRSYAPLRADRQKPPVASSTEVPPAPGSAVGEDAVGVQCLFYTVILHFNEVLAASVRCDGGAMGVVNVVSWEERGALARSWKTSPHAICRRLTEVATEASVHFAMRARAAGGTHADAVREFCIWLSQYASVFSAGRMLRPGDIKFTATRVHVGEAMRVKKRTADADTMQLEQQQKQQKQGVEEEAQRQERWRR